MDCKDLRKHDKRRTEDEKHVVELLKCKSRTWDTQVEVLS